MTERFQVLIADDSPIYRKIITRAVTASIKNADFFYAADREQVMEQVDERKYELVILDVRIAKSGLPSLISKIQRESSSAQVVIMAGPSPDNTAFFVKAMAMGAAYCMVKPVYDSYEENLVLIKSIIKNLIKNRQKNTGKQTQKTNQQFCPELVLIAASTGGPPALKEILSSLSADFPVPILVIQHMPSLFIGSLAEDMNRICQLEVKLAADGDCLSAGKVYIAPGEYHMMLDSEKRILLDGSPPVRGIRPAADVLFQSVSDIHIWSGILVVVLSGMGHDGVDGLITLKRKHDCVCLVQSERTCVVYGMPRAAVEKGVADMILDLDEMAAVIEGFHYSFGDTEKS